MQVEWKSINTSNIDFFLKQIFWDGKIKVHLFLFLSPLIWSVISSSVRIWWCIARIFFLQYWQMVHDSSCMRTSVTSDVEGDVNYNIGMQPLWSQLPVVGWAKLELTFKREKKVLTQKAHCNFNLYLWWTGFLF